MSSAPLSTTARKNIDAIAQVEQQLHGRRSRVERLGDGIAAFFSGVCGSLPLTPCFYSSGSC